MTLFACQVCGQIEFSLPAKACPVCHSSDYREETNPVKDSTLEGNEKHVPVIIITSVCGIAPDTCRDIHIKIGSIIHPMTEDHWIKWIDTYVNRRHQARYMMSPQSMQPIISLHLKKEAVGTVTVVECCNKHGRWMAETSL
jgi:superoxide reductase